VISNVSAIASFVHVAPSELSQMMSIVTVDGGGVSQMPASMHAAFTLAHPEEVKAPASATAIRSEVRIGVICLFS
jgi:hypothetical protein